MNPFVHREAGESFRSLLYRLYDRASGFGSSARRSGAWKGTRLVLLTLLFSVQGCANRRLQVKMLNQAGALPNVYYQEVLNNVAMIRAEPASMPYFSDPQTARVGVQQSANANNRLYWELITTGPVGALTLFDRFLLARESPSIGASRGENGEWSAVTDNDPDKLFTMRAAYHRVIGQETAEDREILGEFYYRHFMITAESLERLRQAAPEVYEKVGSKLQGLSDIEFLTSDDFEARLRENDMLGHDLEARYRRPILNSSRMLQEPNEFVSDADTHHLLYLQGLNPGWIGLGNKKQVPKNAAFRAIHGETAVWVTPDHIEDLTRLTFAILDIHTYHSNRLGGSRVLPGIVVR